MEKVDAGPDGEIEVAADGRRFALTDLQRTWWKGKTGQEWVHFNPEDASGQDDIWMQNWGIKKTDAFRQVIGDTEIPTKMSWLEMGCSRGAHMSVMEALGWSDLTGVDICHEPLANANEGFIPIQGDAVTMPFKDQSFDGFTSSGSLIGFGAPQSGLKKAVKEIDRVTREWLLIAEPWRESPMICVHHLKDRDYPPSVVLPWEDFLTYQMPGWEVLGREVWYNLNDPNAEKGQFPICVLLMRRTGR